MSKYIERLPIEIVLKSTQGKNVGSLDGHKKFVLSSEIFARKDENLLFYLKKASIPFSFYTLSNSQRNNMLGVIEHQTTGQSHSYTITIPDGNYSITELASQIKSQLESGSTYNFKYNISFNTATGKVTFLRISGDSALKTELLFSSTVNNCRRILGFDDENIEFTSSITGSFVVDMADGLDQIHISSNLVGSNIRSTKGEAGELLLVPVYLERFSVIYFDSMSPFKHKLSTQTIKEIEIKMTDANGNTIDFNNVPYTLICEVEFIHNMNESIEENALEADNKETYENRLAMVNNLLQRAQGEKEKKK